MKTAIFFIAIIPNFEIRSEIKAFKEYAQEHFDSAHALRSPAHITLQPPFKWPISLLPSLESALKSFTEKQTPFDIYLSDFDVFSPRVIFVNVLGNSSLQDLQKELENLLSTEFNLQSDRPDRPYHPHMTIAFKDLRKEMFTKGWDHFSRMSYIRNFKADRICLLQHNGTVWEEKIYFRMKTH